MPRLARDSAILAALGLAVGAAAAAAVAVAGAQAALRGWYDLNPTHPGGVAAAVVLRRNLTLAAGVLAAAVAVAAWPRARFALDALLALMLGGNVLLVGVAVGAYGGPLLRLIAPHAAVELAAAAVAAAGYLDARRARAVHPTRLAACGAAATALLATAAVIEAGAGR